MGVSAAVFESAGKRTEHYIPGAYSRGNNVSSPNGVNAGNLCILGCATGGKPRDLLEFGSLSEAQDVLKSGDLLNAIGYAFKGSPDYVPSSVMAMRVNPGTQGTLTMKSGETPMIEISSADYGAHVNQIKVKVDTGTLAGSKKLSVSFQENTTVVDNIIRKSMQIMAADGENGTVTVTTTGISLQTTVEDEVVSEEFLFEDYPTVNDLVARINDTDFFVATMLDTNIDALSTELDTVASKDISSAPVDLCSNFAAFCEELEKIQFFDEIKILSENSRVMVDNMPFTYFTGGTTTKSASTSDWGLALAELETKDIQIITTIESSPEIHSLIKDHCTTMSSTVNRKERSAWLGGPLNESDDDAMANARALNSSLISYVCDTAFVSNPFTGAKEKVAGSIFAVMLAGMESSMAVNMALTNKTLNVLGFAKTRTVTNMNNLIKAGVVVCQPSPDDPTNYVCIRSITTYQKDDLIANERSMTREAMYMDRDLRNRYGIGIGMPGNMPVSVIKQTLIETAKEWAASGYIIPSDDGQNVWDIKVVRKGDKDCIQYSRYLTAPVNFVFITANNYVYTSSTEL
ncbi:hypothetical protein [Treponema sp.]|uniref:hypothetical protein n=1 Tax=Treponema sp. TaxID=166 RepID=UPI00298DD2AB|nr:hypothetical protein [Treponema sp.]MCQ2242470.1 hypothetical protein [Treponema sp.]